MPKDHHLVVGDPAIYPPHGIGRVVDIAKQEIAGQTVEIIVLWFESVAMTIRVPSSNLGSVGLRPVASKVEMKEALRALVPSDDGATLPMGGSDWKRRFKQYVDQVNSGKPVLIAQVVKELCRNAGADPLSATALAIYNTAVSRLSQELAIVEQIAETEAAEHITRIAQGAAPQSAAPQSAAP
jgi:CarD family transcriptional regulator